MRNPNTMLKSALMSLALATASVAAFSSEARASGDSAAAESSSSSELTSSKTPAVVPNPMPGPVTTTFEEDPFVRADLNRDGHHNIDDLIMLIMAWGTCPNNGSFCTADINLDGVVDENDLLFLLRLMNIDS